MKNFFYIFKWKNKYLSFKNSKQSNFLTNPSKSNKFFLNNRTTPRIRLFRVNLIHNFTLLYIINEKIHISTQKKIIVINDLNIKNRWFNFNLDSFFFPKNVDYEYLIGFRVQGISVKYNPLFIILIKRITWVIDIAPSHTESQLWGL